MPKINSTDLRINSPVVAPAPDGSLEVAVAANAPLRPGVYTFQLAVTDDSGNQSEPAQFRLIVADDQKPTAVIDGPTRISSTSGFTLSGKRSIDAGGGTIKTFTWTLLQAP